MALIKSFAYFLLIFKLVFQFQAAFATDDDVQPQVTCLTIGNRKIDVNVQTNLKTDLKHLLQQYSKLNQAENAKQQIELTNLRQYLEIVQEKQTLQTAELQKLRNDFAKQLEDFKFEIVEAISEMLQEQAHTVSKPAVTARVKSNAIAKNYDQHFNCIRDCSPVKYLPDSCEQAMMSMDGIPSGLYLLNTHDSASSKPFYAVCERFDGQTWTIIQNRVNGAVNFNRTWSEYKQGFGNLGIGEDFWLGLQRLHELTTKHPHELLIRMRNHDGIERYARYANFMIGDENEKYKLTIGGYHGNAGDAMSPHNGMKFSTYDVDNDNDQRNCASTYEGGWWFHKCHDSLLNGPFEARNSSFKRTGMAWSFSETYLKFAQMAIRRTVVPKQKTEQYHCSCAANLQELKQVMCD